MILKIWLNVPPLVGVLESYSPDLFICRTISLTRTCTLVPLLRECACSRRGFLDLSAALYLFFLSQYSIPPSDDPRSIFWFSCTKPWIHNVSLNIRIRTFLLLTLYPFLTVSLADIDNYITLFQNLSSLFPRSHFKHTVGVNGPAMMRSLRYDLSGLRDDLDECTLHLTEAILLPALSVDGCGLSSVPLLFQLASALLQRSKQFEQTRAEDVFYSIQYLHYLQALPLDSSGVLRNDVTGLLVESLGLQFGLGTQNTTRNVKEMVVHCRELLASDILTDFPITAFLSLSLAIQVEHFRGRHVQSVYDAIECLRQAVKLCPPHSH